MGRIKVFFCSFCLDRGPDQTTNDHSFNQGIDVSHLATPHISSNQSLAARSPSNTTPTCENNDDNYSHYNLQGQGPIPQSCAIVSQQSQLEVNESNRNTPERESIVCPSSYHQQQDTNSHQASPPSHAPSPLNLYELQDHRAPSPPELQQHQLYNERNAPALQHQQPNVPHQAAHSSSNSTTAKLSYDIISVREPLAKILAEKQQLLQAQQQQRQLLGDHEYIEVYGERGSSCFYEEIAGSVTSSATYDQIGAASNHNYQALINAYAVASRQNAPNQDGNGNAHEASSFQNSNELHNSQSNSAQENMYDVTNLPDQLDGPSVSNHQLQPLNSPISSATDQEQSEQSSQTSKDSRIMQVSRSIPVYSVINKATRRSNSIMRTTVESSRPPKPPPKNLLISQQSTSAIHTYSKPSTSTHQTNSFRAWSPSRIPSTSSYTDNKKINCSNEIEENNGHRGVRLPQPPPRFSKHPTFNAIDRPLPLPDKFDNINNNNNNGTIIDRNSSRDDDIESLNNGYELLRSNLEDDQIDVGYEKIRESNRYSGGSLSSQLYQLQLFDNGGYESVQPIYSSPSNALAEPNYEAIAPSTASELAAAATAKLTAAATVIERILKQD